MHLTTTLAFFLVASPPYQTFGFVPIRCQVSSTNGGAAALYHRRSFSSFQPSHHHQQFHRLALSSSSSEEEEDGSSSEKETTGKTNTNKSSSSSSTEIVTSTNNGDGIGEAIKSLLIKIDDLGQRMKPLALEAKNQATLFSKDGGNRTKVILYTIKSSILYSLFMLYRAYRGFFVILPEVFREVYRKLEKSVDTPFLDDDDDDDILMTTTNNNQPIRLRTAITVSILSCVVTASYVIGGAIRVFTKFLKSITHGNNVSSSFGIAADEVMKNEDKILKFAHHQQQNRTFNSNNINGDNGNNVDPSKLTP